MAEPGEDEDAGEFTRTPPHDLLAETVTLGAMLLSADAIAAVTDILAGAADFYRPAHQLVYDAALHLFGRGEPVDAITVAAELTRRGDISRMGGGAYLHTLISAVPTAGSAPYYARIVVERAVQRRTVEVGMRITQMGYEAPHDGPGELAERAEGEVMKIAARPAGEDYLPASQVIPSTMDEIEAIQNAGGRVSGVPTGIADLDAMTTGLHPGQFVIIAARPAIGKSALGINWAAAAAVDNKIPTVIFSLEMNRNEIGMRLLSAESRVPMHAMRSGQLRDADWERIAARQAAVADSPLFIDDSPSMSMLDIRSKCRRLHQRHGLGLVIIDYLQLMSQPGRSENRQQEVSQISRSLKLLAKELGVPVVAMSQLNRGPEQRNDKRPLLSDLRESGCMTADTTLMRADTGEPVTFGDLMKNGHDGVLVWSVDERRKLVPAPVTSVFASGVKNTFRLRLRSGRQVKASGNHKFLTFAGWKPLEELAVNDRIAVPRRLPEPFAAGLGWTEYRLGLLAHLIGDGCVLRGQPLHYTSQDAASLDFVERAVAAEFGITARRVRQGNWFHSYLPNPQHSARGRRNPLHDWFSELGIDDLRSYEKKIPVALHGASRAEIALFLRHLWATDGRVAEPSSMASGIAGISYATTSRALADGVATLLTRFGIATRVVVIREKLSERPGYRVLIQSGPDMRTFCEVVGVHGARGLRSRQALAELTARPANTNVDTLPREIWELVRSERRRAGMSERAFQAAIGTHYCGSSLYKSGLSRERLMRCAEALNSDVLREHATSDVFWDQVTAIEPLGPQPVFDATVKGTHSFIADGVIAHNSLEQDADLVILMHREDAYERESPRAGEADLIVAKHRNGPTGTVTVAFQPAYATFVDMAPLDAAQVAREAQRWQGDQ